MTARKANLVATFMSNTELIWIGGRGKFGRPSEKDNVNVQNHGVESKWSLFILTWIYLLISIFRNIVSLLVGV